MKNQRQPTILAPITASGLTKGAKITIPRSGASWDIHAHPRHTSRCQDRPKLPTPHPTESESIASARDPLRAKEKTARILASDAGWSSPVAREAHNLEVAGSNPVPATLTSGTTTSGVARFRISPCLSGAFVVSCQSVRLGACTCRTGFCSAFAALLQRFLQRPRRTPARNLRP